MASVEIIDMREDFQRTHQAGPISTALHEAITECLAQKTQALVLINRRGYSWSVMCRSCGASVQCENCSISMTHHKRAIASNAIIAARFNPSRSFARNVSRNTFIFSAKAPSTRKSACAKNFPARASPVSIATPRAPSANIRRRSAHSRAAPSTFWSARKCSPRATISSASRSSASSAPTPRSALPDFRAAERTFQLLTQVAGRAGRGDLPGRVLIQTYYPEHYAIQDAVRQDYAAFYERETQFRRMMAYPPFTSLANVIVRDIDLEKAIRWSRLLSEYFSAHDGKTLRVLGPATAPLAKLKTEHRFQFLLKSPHRSVLTKRPLRRPPLRRFQRNPPNRHPRRHGPPQPPLTHRLLRFVGAGLATPGRCDLHPNHREASRSIWSAAPLRRLYDRFPPQTDPPYSTNSKLPRTRFAHPTFLSFRTEQADAFSSACRGDLSSFSPPLDFPFAST